MTGNNARGIVIQPRDRHLLREISAMRIIDREQAKLVAGFRSTTRANARLLALYRAGLLKRIFQGTTAGGKKALYACSESGAQLVGAAYHRFRHRDNELIVTNFFVTHQYWVNWVYCWTKYTAISPNASSFSRWLRFSEAIVPSLIPDGYFEIATPHGPLASFVEVDLGNEGAAVWKKKVQQYLRYAASGNFERQFHHSRFRVVLVANTNSRMQRLRKLIRGLTDKIFWLSSFETIHREGYWAAVWQRPAEDRPKAFV